MNRRKFLSGVCSIGMASVAGCIDTVQDYSLEQSVKVDKGTLTLSEVNVTRSIFTAQMDKTTGIIAKQDSQFVVFLFRTNLGVREGKIHDYLYDNLQYRLSRDTVAQGVSVPVLHNELTGVAFYVPTVFSPNNSRLVWTGGTDAQWNAEEIISETQKQYLKNPPSYTVNSVNIPESTDSNTVTVGLNISNTGGTTGEFKAVVRGDSTKLVDTPIKPGNRKDIEVDVNVSEPETRVLVTWGSDQRSSSVS